MTGTLANYREARGLGIAFALCALATLTLLANHPNAGAHDLADFIKEEARNQFIDGLVHGGFIATQGALSVCLLLLSRRLGSDRVPVVIAVVAFFIGCGALMASMILDGFASPAIAARLAGTDSADNLLMAKTLLILVGTLIRFLMPMGILLQSVALLAWSAVIAQAGGMPRAVGVFGSVAAVALIVVLLAAPVTMTTHVLLGGILLQATWYLALAALLLAQQVTQREHECEPDDGNDRLHDRPRAERGRRVDAQIAFYEPEPGIVDVGEE
jgi:hypothetical protein